MDTTDLTYYGPNWGYGEPGPNEELSCLYKRFSDNVDFILTWNKNEISELVDQGVDLRRVTHDYLIQWREDLHLKVSKGNI